MERLRAFGGRCMVDDFMVGIAGDASISPKFNIPAERQPTDLPVRSVVVMKAYNRPAKANREALDSNAEGTRHHEVTKFVHKYDQRQHDEEGGYRDGGPPPKPGCKLHEGHKCASVPLFFSN